MEVDAKACGILYVVNDPDDAQILWTWVQIESAGEEGFSAKPHQFVNQFPYESCLVMKHHLAQTVHQVFCWNQEVVQEVRILWCHLSRYDLQLCEFVHG